MREVVVSATARSELRNIASYLASFGSGTARSFAREFERKVASLEEGVVEYPYSEKLWVNRNISTTSEI